MPPLPFEAAQSDLVYAISVFTHMPEEAQVAWVGDIRRVLRPGGILIATFHGRAFRHLLRQDDAVVLERLGVVVTNAEFNGTNVCASFNSEAHVRTRLAADWEVISYRERGGSAVGVGEQDLYVMTPGPAA